jgi:hypothetical protein
MREANRLSGRQFAISRPADFVAKRVNSVARWANSVAEAAASFAEAANFVAQSGDYSAELASSTDQKARPVEGVSRSAMKSTCSANQLTSYAIGLPEHARYRGRCGEMMGRHAKQPASLSKGLARRTKHYGCARSPPPCRSPSRAIPIAGRPGWNRITLNSETKYR